MKTVAVLFIFSAFVAFMSAEDIQFHHAVFDFLDERHDHRMAQLLRDEGIPDQRDAKHENPPDFLKPCIAKGQKCWNDAGHDACKKLTCIGNFIQCAIDHSPTPLPELTLGEKFCLGVLHECIRQSPSCEGKLCCFVRIKRCFQQFEGGEFDGSGDQGL